MKTWKINPSSFVLLEILKKKGSLTDSELFEALTDELKDLGYKDFNELLMQLEIGGKIRITHVVRGKRRIEYLSFRENE